MTMKAGFILGIIPRTHCKIRLQKSYAGLQNPQVGPFVAAGPWLGSCQEVKQVDRTDLSLQIEVFST
jgi:hypothetical protein